MNNEHVLCNLLYCLKCSFIFLTRHVRVHERVHAIIIFYTTKNGRLETNIKLECGPMPNVIAARPNIGGAVCESSIIPLLLPRRKVWLAPTGRVPCSNAANV